MDSDLICYIGQKAFIEKDGKILVLIDPQVGLDTPGGRIQIGETDLKLSLEREILEETQLNIRVGEPFITWLYQIPKDSGHRGAGKTIFHVGYRCTYVSGEIDLSEVHSSFAWVDKESYKEIPSDKSYRDVLDVYFHKTR